MNPNLPNQSPTPSNTQPSLPGNKTIPVPAVYSGGGKEQGTISSSLPIEAVSHPEEYIPKEVTPHIEVRPEKVDVPLDVAQLGVQVAGSQQSVNPQSTATVTVTLPLTDDQVVSNLHPNVTSSISWLAIWCIRQLKRAHLALKVVHGRVMRVKA